MHLNIRLANRDDIDVLYKMSMNFVKASGYKFIPDEQKIKHLIETIISSHASDKMCVVLTDMFDIPVGMLAAIIEEPFFSKQKIAQELVWWVDPSYRGKRKSLELVEAYEHWAKLRGATLIQMASIASLDGEKVGSVLERMGYRKTELSYCKEF